MKRGRTIPNKIIDISAKPESTFVAIDWDKVKTINDLKTIMSNMGLGCFTNAPNYESLKKYLQAHENPTQD